MPLNSSGYRNPIEVLSIAALVRGTRLGPRGVDHLPTWTENLGGFVPPTLRSTAGIGWHVGRLPGPFKIRQYAAKIQGTAAMLWPPVVGVRVDSAPTICKLSEADELYRRAQAHTTKHTSAAKL
jgi:hypothetical protein